MALFQTEVQLSSAIADESGVDAATVKKVMVAYWRIAGMLNVEKVTEDGESSLYVTDCLGNGVCVSDDLAYHGVAG